MQYDLTDESSIDEFQQILNAFSLTMERKTVIFRSVDFFAKKRSKFIHAKWHEVFKKYLDNYSSSNLLIIITGETGGIDAEIHKIILKHGVEKIYHIPAGGSANDGNSKDISFRIADAIIAKDINAALNCCESIPAADVIPSLSMIGWSIRILSDFIEMKHKKMQEPDIENALALKPFQYKKYNNAYQVWTADSIKKAVKALAETDFTIKSTGIDPKRSFEALLFDLCDKE